MVLEFKLTYHKRLFLILIAFTWAIISCFIAFQYIREKQFKTEFINIKLQTYNKELLYEIDKDIFSKKKINKAKEYFNKANVPFNNLRISIISFSGEVIYDNLLSYESMENHVQRPEIISANKTGVGYHKSRLS